MNRLQCVFKIPSLLGECPLWAPTEQVLYWIDILKGLVHRFDPSINQNQTIQLHQLVSSIGHSQENKLILTLRKQIALLDLKSHQLSPIAEVEQNLPDNRFNDGKCDRLGNFWCTSMNQKELHKDSAGLYRIDRERRVKQMESHVILGNGMAWSPDNRTFYFTQTLRYTIFAYDFDPATCAIGNRREFAKFQPTPVGGPDGLTVDEEGCLWSAHYGSSAVHRFDSSGKLLQTIELPVPRVTSIAFGGRNLETLYITTAQEGMTPEELKKYPLSGSLFAVDVKARGLPEPMFG